MNEDLKNLYNEHSDRKGADFVMSEESAQRVKHQIFDKLGSVVVEEQAPTPFFSLRKFVLRTYVIAPMVVLLFVVGTTYASADALPGDTLYSVKRQVENARILIAPSEEAKMELQESFTQKRLDELERIQVNRGRNSSGKADENKSEGTVIDIDSETVSSERKDNNERGNKEQSNRRERARDEANKAVESLQKARENWETKGNNEKAKEVERKVKLYRKQLENRDGQVRGATDQIQNRVNNIWQR